jgi:glucan phosphorylase
MRHGEWIKIHVNFAGRTVWAKVWQLSVGRVPLYLLDTDIDDNIWEDRSITHQLYGGDNENRLRQEILLGIGGVRALKAMHIRTGPVPPQRRPRGIPWAWNACAIT